jgi:hypothetical protein
VNRWQALFKIVESFNRHGKPRLAFAFGVVFLVLPVIAWVLIASRVGVLIPLRLFLSG